MAQLNITRLYADGEVLFEADLDEVSGDMESLLNVTRLNDDNIQDGGITGSTKLADGSVTAGLIESLSITTSKILDASVDTAALGDLAVTTAKIAAADVEGAKFATNAVTVAKLNRDRQIQDNDGNDSTTNNTSFEDAGMSCSLLDATGNRKVLVFLTPNDTVALPKAGGVYLTRTVASSNVVELGGSIKFLRGSTVIGQWDFKFQSYRGSGTSTAYRYSIPPMTFICEDLPPAGSVSYSCEFKVSSASTTLGICADLRCMEVI